MNWSINNWNAFGNFETTNFLFIFGFCCFLRDDERSFEEINSPWLVCLFILPNTICVFILSEFFFRVKKILMHTYLIFLKLFLSIFSPLVFFLNLFTLNVSRNIILCFAVLFLFQEKKFNQIETVNKMFNWFWFLKKYTKKFTNNFRYSMHRLFPSKRDNSNFSIWIEVFLCFLV